MPETKASAPADPVRLLPRDIAEDALAFLTRVDGGCSVRACEVDRFMRVRVALEAIAMRGSE